MESAETSPTTSVNWVELREPFDDSDIDILPRVTCNDCVKGTCNEHQKISCRVCGAKISSAHIHLNYVGHAAVTRRLLTCDPTWHWEPLALTPDGNPKITKTGNYYTMWIRLYVGGINRIGVGTVLDRPNRNIEIEKELISDAIRNAAMRFGVALEQWHKTPQSSNRSSSSSSAPTPRPPTSPAIKAAASTMGIDARDVAQIITRIEGAAALSDLAPIAQAIRSRGEQFKSIVSDAYNRKLQELRTIQNAVAKAPVPDASSQPAPPATEVTEPIIDDEELPLQRSDILLGTPSAPTPPEAPVAKPTTAKRSRAVARANGKTESSSLQPAAG